jgi:anti-anti-sigma factor
MLGEVNVLPDATVAHLHGDLDLVNVESLRDLLDDVCSTSAARVIIDLCDVPFVDVLSLSVILGAADGMRESGRELVVEGARSPIRRLCSLLNAEDVLEPSMPLPFIAVPPAC